MGRRAPPRVGVAALSRPLTEVLPVSALNSPRPARLSWLRVAVTCAVLIVVAGCATSSQIIPVNPALDVSPLPATGGGRTLALSVVDGRADDTVGYRDPNKPETRMVSSPEAIGNIQRVLERAYADLGFLLVPPGDLADVEMEVRLVEFGYARAASGLVRNLDTGARIDVESVMSGKTVNATFRDGQGQDTVIAPSLKANAEVLNHHLNGALGKLVSDQRLTTP